MVMTKICETCKQEFVITKHQTTKRYCSAPCSKGYYKSTNKKMRTGGGKYA